MGAQLQRQPIPLANRPATDPPQSTARRTRLRQRLQGCSSLLSPPQKDCAPHLVARGNGRPAWAGCLGSSQHLDKPPTSPPIAARARPAQTLPAATSLGGAPQDYRAAGLVVDRSAGLAVEHWAGVVVAAWETAAEDAGVEGAAPPATRHCCCCCWAMRRPSRSCCSAARRSSGPRCRWGCGGGWVGSARGRRARGGPSSAGRRCSEVGGAPSRSSHVSRSQPTRRPHPRRTLADGLRRRITRDFRAATWAAPPSGLASRTPRGRGAASSRFFVILAIFCL